MYIWTKGHTGYLYLKPTKDDDFITACKPCWMYDGDNTNELMLFRLVRYEDMYVPNPNIPNPTPTEIQEENDEPSPPRTEDQGCQVEPEASSVHMASYIFVCLFRLAVPVLRVAMHWRL